MGTVVRLLELAAVFGRSLEYARSEILSLHITVWHPDCLDLHA
jgi:hypothetical protein